ncbi:MAG: glycerol-3-phosphate dehydrogenase/oxidase [Planctomycetaceae bacterium]
MKRSEMLTAMEDRRTVWDVIVIGGGATGLGAAVEAAARGHRTLLVEAEDFAKGTSSRSTKLIHGGVRYLRQGRIGMVRQSLRERERLLRNAPHVVHSLDFVLPTYRWGARTIYYAGLRAYDMLAGQWISGRARRLSRSETCERLSTLRDDGVRGGVLYSDGQFDDARLAITLARTAVDLGAVVANYMAVVRLVRNQQRVTGVIVRDTESGKEFELRGRVVLNATGVFAEDILRMDTDSQQLEASDDHSRLVVSQGSHLVLDASFLPGSTALMIPETDDGRVLFAIPWHGKVLLGTTDLAVRNVTREPRPLPSEIEYLLEHAGRYLQRSPTETDIRSRFAGLRPLVGAKSGSNATAKLSREHEIYTAASGLITVIGGKWTTYRHMGEELINIAEVIAGLPRQQSRTASLKLHGSPSNFNASDTQTRNIYGSDGSQIESLIRESPELASRLHPRLPYRAAEVIWAARHEMAQTIEDILARRTRALFLDAHAAMESAAFVGELLQREFNRSPDWKVDQLQRFSAIACGYCQ